MIYDWTATIALAALRDLQLSAPLCLEGDGLWVCLVSSGQCTAALTDVGALPPQTAQAGQLVLSRVYPTRRYDTPKSSIEGFTAIGILAT